jgi:predicted TIM-barrel fold metal-dependent hydrolase
VCTLAGDEPLWRDIIGELTADWSSNERRAFYSDNANRLYGLARNANR